MDIDAYALMLGKVLVNLHSLEFILRAFLSHQEEQRTGKTSPIDLNALKVGDTVSVDALSNYDSLDQLVKKYNSIVAEKHPDLCVDNAVVSLRDSLAHGRVFSNSLLELPTILVKFDKPIQGEALVTHTELLDDNWGGEKVKFVFDQIHQVRKADVLFHPDQQPDI